MEAKEGSQGNGVLAAAYKGFTRRQGSVLVAHMYWLYKAPLLLKDT